MYFQAPPSTPLVGKKLLLTPFNLPDVHKLHAGPPSAAQAFGRYGQRYHGDERGVDDEYDGGQEDDYMYENQREGSGEARETARGGADDAMEGRRAVEGGGPGDATEGGEGGRRRRGKRKVGDG